jgi:hypothetical protein
MKNLIGVPAKKQTEDLQGFRLRFLRAFGVNNWLFSHNSKPKNKEIQM